MISSFIFYWLFIFKIGAMTLFTKEKVTSTSIL